VWLRTLLGLPLTSDGFGWTFLAALIVSLVSWGLESLLEAAVSAADPS
jgi:uncharacterized membrane protein YvlD (DUF360 family)